MEQQDLLIQQKNVNHNSFLKNAITVSLGSADFKSVSISEQFAIKCMIVNWNPMVYRAGVEEGRSHGDVM